MVTGIAVVVASVVGLVVLLFLWTWLRVGLCEWLFASDCLVWAFVWLLVVQFSGLAELSWALLPSWWMWLLQWAGSLVCGVARCYNC